MRRERVGLACADARGALRLRLQPRDFWQLTPAELQLMLGDPGAAPVGRSRLEEMMRAFPDRFPERPDQQED